MNKKPRITFISQYATSIDDDRDGANDLQCKDSSNSQYKGNIYFFP